jgi:cyclophilin family peptidyl-prolyl cis-trans isomerase
MFQACRNFVQLCLERYYDSTIFHRVVKDFMVQCGDPTGTGTGARPGGSAATQAFATLTYAHTLPAVAGGESAFGEPFKDEFHSRLHFNHRGQVAMANSGKANDNASQARIHGAVCMRARLPVGGAERCCFRCCHSSSSRWTSAPGWIRSTPSSARRVAG